MRPAAFLLSLSLIPCFAAAQTASQPPTADIGNGVVKATLYLPDATNGFYRGTRFDWSGVVADLAYKGHHYYGPWFTKTAPDISDFVYQGADIVAGPCSAITGPVEEFNPAIGYDEAKPGGTFLKIGVGMLKKLDNQAYSPYTQFPIVNGGKWSVKKSADAVEFTQELHDAASGFAYLYQKRVSLTAGKPEMKIEHSLKNLGKRPLEANVYDHNFLVLDKRPTDAGYTIEFPFDIKTDKMPDPALAAVVKNKIAYKKTLTGKDVVTFPITGYGNSSSDYKIRIENAKAGAGMTIEGDHPLGKLSLWSIRSIVAVEPFVDLKVAPGAETHWGYRYEYFTMAAR